MWDWFGRGLGLIVLIAVVGSLLWQMIMDRRKDSD